MELPITSHNSNKDTLVMSQEKDRILKNTKKAKQIKILSSVMTQMVLIQITRMIIIKNKEITKGVSLCIRDSLIFT